MEMIGSLQVKMIAIVLGATNSLLDLELPFGYHLKRMKLKDVSIKDDILSASGRLDTKYIASNLSDDDNPEFIFISKEENMTIPAKYFVLSEMMTGNEQAYAYFDSIQSTWNHELFLIIFFLHLCKEGNIEIADKYFTFTANYGCNNIRRNGKSSLDLPISVYDDLYEWDNNRKNIYQELISLSGEILEEMQDVFGRFDRGYSASRFDDAYKNLVTLSEILLIGYNSNDKRGDKKIKFSNRITAALANDAEARDMQALAKKCYKDRSDETHEGKNDNIDKDTLSELRCLVRRIIIDFVHYYKSNYAELSDKSFAGAKRDYVKALLVRVEYLKDNGYIE